jgi:hypothetical protein
MEMAGRQGQGWRSAMDTAGENTTERINPARRGFGGRAALAVFMIIKFTLDSAAAKEFHSN